MKLESVLGLMTGDKSHFLPFSNVYRVEASDGSLEVLKLANQGTPLATLLKRAIGSIEE